MIFCTNCLFIGSCNTPVASIMTSQLLLLYYLLLYEDVRLTNSHQLLASSRRVLSYSPHLFAQLPIRYLLSHAQKEQRLYAGMLQASFTSYSIHFSNARVNQFSVICMVSSRINKIIGEIYNLIRNIKVAFTYIVEDIKKLITTMVYPLQH